MISAGKCIIFKNLFDYQDCMSDERIFGKYIFFLISHSYSNYSVGLELQDWQSKNKTRTNDICFFFFFFFFCDFDIF